ncbi:Flp family type IVb pilin [Nocardioides speluncae]|uniref:Flp family type IVb pilin n=1 Tax=Nocardioides speluncae TaxID=2670337 RepID=UPI000D688A65|nr:Flp family type IVb pilin [Nocardioides speluncae]
MLEKIHLFLTDVRAERRSERGATATEYSLLVAFIALVIVAGVFAFGTDLGTLFEDMGAVVGLWPTSP